MKFYTDDEWDIFADEFEDHYSGGGTLRAFWDGERRPGLNTFYARMKRDANLEERYIRALRFRAMEMLDAMDEIVKGVQEGEIKPAAGNAILRNLEWRAARFYKVLLGSTEDPEKVGAEDLKLMILEAARKAQAERALPPSVIDAKFKAVREDN